MVGQADTYFTGSIANAMFFEGQGAKDIQFANDDLARYTIHTGGMNHFHSGISADGGATFGGDIIANNLTLDSSDAIALLSFFHLCSNGVIT